MGQQQLLLIMLGVIIAGMAIYAGVRMFDSYQQDNERDLVIQQINVLVLEARKYSARPEVLAGGSGGFAGFQPPENLAMTDRFRIYCGATDSAVTFSGFGSINGSDGQSPVQVVVQYTLADNRSTVDVVN